MANSTPAATRNRITGRRVSTRQALIAILAMSVLLRVAVALYLGGSFDDIRGGTHDQISYDMLAQRVAGGHGFSFDRDWWPYAKADQPTAFWSYLYTGYLAVIYLLFGHTPLLARLLQAVLVGVLTPLLLYRIGARTFNRHVGLFASAIAAVYLYFVDYGASLMTEALYIVGILWTIDAVTRLVEALQARNDAGRPLGSRQVLLRGLEMGLAMGVSILLRQVVLFLFIVMILWVVWVGARRRRLRGVVTPVLVSGVVVAAILAPWMWRNARVFGRLTLPNTNAGFTFFWSNHPIHGTHFEPVLSADRGLSYQELIPPELRHLNEAALDRALLRRALAFVIEDPVRYVLLSLSRVPVFFLFWPTADSSFLSNLARVLSFGLFLPFMVHGLVLSALRAWHRWKAQGLEALARITTTPQFLFVLFVGVYTCIHLASWANVRYRLPVDAFLMLFGGYGIDHLVAKYAHHVPGTADAAGIPSCSKGGGLAVQ